MSDEKGFELVEARASKRLEKWEPQRKVGRERVERDARVQEEGKQDRLRQHQEWAKGTQARRD